MSVSSGVKTQIFDVSWDSRRRNADTKRFRIDIDSLCGRERAKVREKDRREERKKEKGKRRTRRKVA